MPLVNAWHVERSVATSNWRPIPPCTCCSIVLPHCWGEAVQAAPMIVKMKPAPGQDAQRWLDICWGWSKKILGNLDSHSPRYPFSH
jgi:hypothetical protein